MQNISEAVLIWVECCREVWSRWFSGLENGEDEFLEVEEVLFSSLVLSRLQLCQRPSFREACALLTAFYRIDVDTERSVCRIQKAGHIFCQQRRVDIRKGAGFPVRKIDSIGTMLDGEPYAELDLGTGEFLLEPIENLTFSSKT